MFDILDEFRRVFWSGMTWDAAVAWARKLEPYFGAYMVVAATGAQHGQKVAL